MPYVGSDWDAIDPEEERLFGVDFTGHVPDGSVIASCVCTVEVVSGTDASASSRLDGSPIITDLIVRHYAKTMVAGVTYRITFLATLSGSSRKPMLWSHVRCIQRQIAA